MKIGPYCIVWDPPPKEPKKHRPVPVRILRFIGSSILFPFAFPLKIAAIVAGYLVFFAALVMYQAAAIVVLAGKLLLDIGKERR